MKIWTGHGAEHSQNLVMVGHFQNLADAENAEHVLGRLEALVREEINAKRMEIDGSTRRFSEHVRKVLADLNLYSIGPAELEQFGYDIDVRRDGTDIIVTTEETDVSSLLKVLVDHKAKVEVYSAHFYPDEKHGRGK